MAIHVHEIKYLGFSASHLVEHALRAGNAALAASIPRGEVLARLHAVRQHPEGFLGDLIFSELAGALLYRN